VTVPRAPSEKLAVLYGLLCGDGSLTSYETAARYGKWRIDFAESDPEVIVEYVRLTKEVFGVSPSVRNRKRWYEAYYCSKIAHRFYSRVLGHRTEKKTGSLRVPDSFRHDPRLLFGFLKGLFTAEGGKEYQNSAGNAGAAVAEADRVNSEGCDVPSSSILLREKWPPRVRTIYLRASGDEAFS
jgi:hypothetical protein